MSSRCWLPLMILLSPAALAAQSPAADAGWSSSSTVAAREGTESLEPWISLNRVGAAEIEGTSRIELAEATVDLAGEAWNHRPGDEVVALLRPLGRAEWSVGAASPAEAGGLFQISALRFPGVGDYELIAGIFPPGELTAGNRVVEASWREQALAVTRRLSVRILAPPPAALDGARPDLAVLTVGGAGVDPQQITPVPARGEVVLRAEGLPAGSRIYLAALAAYSDRGYLHGPARRDLQSGLYVLQGVPLEIPGDPRHAHLELIAVASQEPLAAGPLSLRSFRRRNLLTSPTVEVTVDERWATAQSWRVPYLAITRIGRHALSPTEPPARPLAVEPGDLVEVGQLDRIPEGARLWILTRPRGSRLWLAQGPALLRGAASPEDPLQGTPEITWVWPGALFELPEEGSGPARRRSASGEFEVLAVLSTITLPGSWIDSSALSSSFLQTVSPLVTVRVRPREPRPPLDLAISRIGGEEVDPETEGTAGTLEQVEVTLREDLEPSLHVYVASHSIGDSLWSLAEAIPRGKTHVVPALSLFDPQAGDGERAQLLAVITSGLLPAEQLEYDDLLRVAVAFSEVVTVRYRQEGIGSLAARFERWWSGAPREVPGGRLEEAPREETETMLAGAVVPASLRNTPESPTRPGGATPRDLPRSPYMSWIWILLVCGILFFVLLIALEWGLGVLSVLARAAAGRGERAMEKASAGVGPLVVIEPATFLLGLFLAVFLWYVLSEHYLPLYAEAVSVVTGLPPRKSFGFALWLAVATALAGTFLELVSDSRVWEARHPVEASGPAAPARLARVVLALRVALGAALVLAIGGLMMFQAYFYYTFLKKTADGSVAILGGAAFLLIAFIEAVAFFFITRLTVVPAGTLFFKLMRSSFSLLFPLFFRTVEKSFGSIPKRRGLRPREEYP